MDAFELEYDFVHVRAFWFIFSLVSTVLQDINVTTSYIEYLTSLHY